MLVAQSERLHKLRDYALQSNSSKLCPFDPL
jgi:hypothetical protein